MRVNSLIKINLAVSKVAKSAIVKYFTLGRVLLLMTWLYIMGNRSGLGHGPRPSKNRSRQLDKARLTRQVGGWVANLFAFAVSSRVMG